jgi:hypothetical protein
LGGDYLEAGIAFAAHKHPWDVKFLIIIHDNIRAFFETSEFTDKRDPLVFKISVISFALTIAGAVIAAAANNTAGITLFSVVIITQKNLLQTYTEGGGMW